jgi:diphosphomevalonate decarboxylase
VTKDSEFRAQASACANFGIVKYWGKRDDALNLPCADSLGVGIEALRSHCELEWGNWQADELLVDGVPVGATGAQRAKRIFDAVRKRAGFSLSARARAYNEFPASAGLASSSSGMAALAVAAAQAARLQLKESELSCLARLGSGSAARAIVRGWTHWRRGELEDGSDSFAQTLFFAEHWPLKVFIVLLSKAPKTKSSAEGMRICRETSVFWEAFQDSCAADIERCKRAIEERNIGALSRCANANSMRLHALCISALPAIWYLQPESIAIYNDVCALAEENIHCVCSFDAGPNPVVLCEAADAERVKRKLLGYGYELIESRVA